jgi:DNA-binding GntR family transcriptional regulator
MMSVMVAAASPASHRTAAPPSTGYGTLAQQAYQRLEDDIVCCALLPGEIVTAEQLQARLQLGATPLREALSRLAAEGLVVPLPRRGYRVTPVTLRGIDELFEAWQVVGPAIAALAATRIDAVGLAQVRALVSGAPGAGSRTSPPDGIAAATRRARMLWSVIAAAAGNEYLRQIFLRLDAQQARLFVLLGRDSGRSRLPSQEAGHALLAALERRDGAAARAQTADFIRAAHREIAQTAQRWPSVMAAEITAR